MHDLSSIEGLRRACPGVVSPEWEERIVNLLRGVEEAASLEQRESEEFHRLIWSDQSISTVSQGKVDVDEAIRQPDLRSWLARESLRPLPDDPQERPNALERIRSELLERLEQFDLVKTPRAMTTRLLAALFPREFTTVVSNQKLDQLLGLMGLAMEGSVPARHRRILDRLDEALGPVSDDGDLTQVARRMTLPWLLLEPANQTHSGNLEFVTKALRDELGLSEEILRSDNRIRGITLDEDGHIRLRPDLSWWEGSTCTFVGDAKYKNITGEREIPNADLYQLLAYATALDLPGGLLVYAKGEAGPAQYRVRHSGKRLEVVALDLSGEIDQLLASVADLARRVRCLRDDAGRPARAA